MILNKLDNLFLYYTSSVLSFSYFWIALAIPFLTSRGLTGAQIFTLMSIYQLTGAFLEYPTGILGDRFGYKKMLTLGNYLSGLAMLIFIFANSYLGYLAGLIVLALASGFLSGNDMGMLNLLSKKIKKDTANYHALSDLSFFFSALLGGYLAKLFGYEWSLFISGFLMTFANVPLYFIQRSNIQDDSSVVLPLRTIFTKGLIALKEPILAQVILVAAVFGGFTFAIKSILGSFGEVYGIDLTIITTYIGLGGLARALGSKLYALLPAHRALLPLSLTAALTLLTGFSVSASLTLNLMLVLQLAIGYISSLIDGDLQELVPNSIRASLFSFKRVILRLVSSLILTVYGYALDFQLQNYVLIATGVSMCLSLVIASRYVKLKLDQK